MIQRMDGFHIDMCMLRTIYSLFKRSGIVQLLSSAGLGRLRAVKKALTSGDVKEGINFHKKLYEALLRTKIKYTDVSKCDKQNVIEVSHANKKEKYITIDELRKGVSGETFENVIVSGNIDSLSNSTPGDMGWLMDTYIEMVNMLLNYVHFLRTGNWKGYLEVFFDFLPYYFRLSRQNYARTLSYYYVHIQALEEENTAAYKYLEHCGFSGSMSRKPHSGIPFDQVIKMTIKSSFKNDGELSGNTQYPGVTERCTKCIIMLLCYVNIITGK